MAPRDSRSVNRCGHAHLACKFPINVTMPPMGCYWRRGIGANLSQAAFTGFCPLAIILKSLGVAPGPAL